MTTSSRAGKSLRRCENAPALNAPFSRCTNPVTVSTGFLYRATPLCKVTIRAPIPRTIPYPSASRPENPSNHQIPTSPLPLRPSLRRKKSTLRRWDLPVRTLTFFFLDKAVSNLSDFAPVHAHRHEKEKIKVYLKNQTPCHRQPLSASQRVTMNSDSTTSTKGYANSSNRVTPLKTHSCSSESTNQKQLP